MVLEHRFLERSNSAVIGFLSPRIRSEQAAGSGLARATTARTAYSHAGELAGMLHG
jgi:hypothetical protein